MVIKKNHLTRILKVLYIQGMNECTSCQKEISDYRYYLGYTECVECSKEEKYSAHQVYPHKTGGFVQQ